MGVYAIIPARGGSKRLPRKNILSLDGKPLMAHVIDVCRKTNLFDDVIVSTEDDEIARLALEYGANVHKRPKTLADDFASVNDVVCDLIRDRKWTDAQDQFCIVYSTAALLKAETLQGAHLEFNQDVNFLMGVSRYNYPPVQALKSNKDGDLSYQFPEFIGKKSKDYPDLCVSNGTFYMGWCKALLKYKTIYGPKLRGFYVNDSEVCDVDYPEDFEKLKERYFARK